MIIYKLFGGADKNPFAGDQYDQPIKFDFELSPNAKDFLKKCLDAKFSTRHSVRQLLTHPWITESDEWKAQAKYLEATKMK